MALSLQAQLLALSLLLWVFTLNCEGAIPKCCISTARFISPRVLRRVDRIQVQSSSGFCDISALIIHVKGKRYCAHMAVKNTLRKMRRRGIRRRKMRKNI